MPTEHTSVDLERPLLEQVETIARELQLSPNQVLAQALEEFVHRHSAQLLLERINQAYEDAPDPEEQEHLRRLRHHHRRRVDGEW